MLKKHKQLLWASVGINAAIVLAVAITVWALFSFGPYSLVKNLPGVPSAPEDRAAEVKDGEKTKNADSKIGDNKVSNYEQSIIQAVNEARPAVVSIVAVKDVPVMERYYREYNPFGQGPFNFRVPDYRQEGTEQREVGNGSGFIVSSDGLVVTNKHVVSDKEAEYAVFTNNGEKHQAEVVARDSFLDLAVLRIEGSGFSSLSFADSSKVSPGQTAIVIGNALGEFQNSVSIGVVSGLSRSIVARSGMGQTEQLREVIQTDAAINPGNSGGPLLNSNGKVIGVSVAMARGSENIGFALPSNAVFEAVKSVKDTGEIVRPYLGVRYINVTERLKEKNNLPVDHGALIISGETREDLAVVPGSPADKAGLESNDIILEVDGEKVTTERTLSYLIHKKQVGEIVSLKIHDDGEEKTIQATLEKASSASDL